eukprot:1148991-Prorocentrum_minimum.AAC.5
MARANVATPYAATPISTERQIRRKFTPSRRKFTPSATSPPAQIDQQSYPSRCEFTPCAANSPQILPDATRPHQILPAVFLYTTRLHLLFLAGAAPARRDPAGFLHLRAGGALLAHEGVEGLADAVCDKADLAHRGVVQDVAAVKQEGGLHHVGKDLLVVQRLRASNDPNGRQRAGRRSKALRGARALAGR